MRRFNPDPETVADWRARYRAGETVRAIAPAGITRQAVHLHMSTEDRAAHWQAVKVHKFETDAIRRGKIWPNALQKDLAASGLFRCPVCAKEGRQSVLPLARRSKQCTTRCKRCYATQVCIYLHLSGRLKGYYPVGSGHRKYPIPERVSIP